MKPSLLRLFIPGDRFRFDVSCVNDNCFALGKTDLFPGLSVRFFLPSAWPICTVNCLNQGITQISHRWWGVYGLVPVYPLRERSHLRVGRPIVFVLPLVCPLVALFLLRSTCSPNLHQASRFSDPSFIGAGALENCSTVGKATERHRESN